MNVNGQNSMGGKGVHGLHFSEALASLEKITALDLKDCNLTELTLYLAKQRVPRAAYFYALNLKI